MAGKRTPQLLAELKKLAADARANIWQRISLAEKILSDRDWVAEVHDGDEIRARDAIEHEYFHELGGTFTIGVLLDIKRAFPDEAKWKECRYNLRHLRLEYEEAKPREEKPPVNRATQKEMQELRDELARSASRADMLAQENAMLRDRVRELEKINAVLEGRLIELERRAA